MNLVPEHAFIATWLYNSEQNVNWWVIEKLPSSKKTTDFIFETKIPQCSICDPDGLCLRETLIKIMKLNETWPVAKIMEDYSLVSCI